MRFALKALLPKMTPGEAMLRFAPDLLSAGFTAASLPQGADAGMRGLAGLEDLGIGVGASLLGGFAGRRGTMALNKRFGKNFDPGQVATIADMATTMPASMLMPRPAYNAAIEDVYSRQQQQQDAQAAFEQQKLQEQLLMGTGYGLGAYGLSMGSNLAAGGRMM